MRNAACSWRARDDPFRLFLRALDDAARLVVDALRLAHLFGHGDAQLVDEVERGRLIEHDVVGHRDATAVRDEGLESLDEEDDVDGIGLLIVAGDSTARC
jgi:hypothetical protein